MRKTVLMCVPVAALLAVPLHHSTWHHRHHHPVPVVTTPAPTPTPTGTTPPPPPSGAQYSALGEAQPHTQASGWDGKYPLADSYCAARVQPFAERVAANATANHTVLAAGTNFRWGPWTRETSETAYNFAHVTGHFSGTTDEIIEWAACKWGLDQNIMKAEAIAESNWKQSVTGDGGESIGILQVRASGSGSPSLDNGWGGYPATQQSTALDADAQMARIRAVYDGQSYMGAGGNGKPVLLGNLLNAVSTWQSGSDTGPDWYTQQIQGCAASHCWTTQAGA